MSACKTLQRATRTRLRILHSCTSCIAVPIAIELHYCKRCMTAQEVSAIPLNNALLDEYAAAEGIATEAELARRMGVNYATLYRARTGRTVDSMACVKGFRKAFPGRDITPLLAA